MPREKSAYLSDVKRAIAAIEQFTSGKGAADYLADSMLQSAVERSSRSSAKVCDN